MLLTAVAIILVLVAVAFVAAPFLEAEPDPEPLPDEREWTRAELEQRKTEAYVAIRDTEMDYRMGKLSEVDYEAIKGKYTVVAIDTLAALDALPPEEEVPSPPSYAGPDVGDESEIRFCPDCGTRRPEGARFCPSCGRGLLATA